MDRAFEIQANHVENCHIISFGLRTAPGTLTVGTREVITKALPRHRPLLHGPTTSRRSVVFKGPFDTLRIYLPQELMKECYEAILGKPAPTQVELFDAHFTRDELVANLAHSLVPLMGDDGPFGPTLVDAVGLALGARLVTLAHKRVRSDSQTDSKPLATWRLRRALDYLEAHLKGVLYLEDLAKVAGLSRMHFAAQFRASTGLSPHAYILKRRIEDAQHLLLDAARSIADIAFEMGFSSQAHFTGAFRKIVGVPPGRWRQKFLPR
ncbi:helix-turn-helix domain-containing protein [Rhizobium sp. WYJ-E13]|uniref:helix-turn-helix domain-containing protein n=1 Tax=Rhizobium sp. WYJ-E13 TaxID=2849093 RepID=UPI001C1ECBC1|nr:AraC family transcriptional regulator [Rhizobium sp. WYJ-E13]QWW72581.1 AraC family transcriptional regulator [Rhizobium sp. WYJ-E13]